MVPLYLHSPKQQKIDHPTHQVSQFHQLYLSTFPWQWMAINHQTSMGKFTISGCLSQFSHLLDDTLLKTVQNYSFTVDVECST
jgi:hypothetical protein